MQYVLRYMDIQDCHYIGSSRRNAMNSVDSGNNLGWLFKVLEVPYIDAQDGSFTGGAWFGMNSNDSGNNVGISFFERRPDNMALMLMNSM